MLTLDPDKRATIAELRSHPWVLMDYTDLGEQIDALPPVLSPAIEEAHLACQAAADPPAERKEPPTTPPHNAPPSPPLPPVTSRGKS